MKKINMHSINLIDFIKKNTEQIINFDSKLKYFEANEIICNNIFINSKDALKNADQNIIFCLLNKKNYSFLFELLNYENIFCFASEEIIELSKEININLNKFNNLFLIKKDFKITKIHALLTNQYFNFKKNQINAFCVTGTNGKSSSVFFSKQIMNSFGFNAAQIGTLGISYEDDNSFRQISKIQLTTPDSFSISKIIDDLNKNHNINNFFIEASSHGIDQDRVMGIYEIIKSIGFLNFSQDHLDYHITMDEYWNSKKKIFVETKDLDIIYSINLDDKKSNELKDFFHFNNLRFLSFSQLNNKADIFLKSFFLDEDYVLNIELVIFKNIFSFKLKSIAFFQISNFMMAVSFLIIKLINDNGDNAANEFLIKYNKYKINEKIFLAPIGRCDVINFKKKNALIIVDYAHTPEALSQIIKDIKFVFDSKNYKILTIFGCGGDRDKEKRPLMGYNASINSDFVIITSDNPRNENPDDIISQILFGANQSNKNNFLAIIDRKKAIEFALKEKIDEYKIIIIAGKGHESGQIIGDQVIEYNDIEFVKNFLATY